MQVNIDDFFREQEQLLKPDLSRQEQHWQELKNRIGVPVKKPGIALWKTVALIVFGIGIGMAGFYLLMPTHKEPAGKQTAVSAIPAQPGAGASPAAENIDRNTQQAETGNSSRPPKPDVVFNREKPTGHTVPRHNGQAVKKLNPGNVINNEAKFYIDLSKEPEIFPLNPLTENTITCKQGTQLIIPANILSDENGNPIKELVSVSIQEYYRYDSNQKRNKTANAGMIKYEFFKGTEKLKVSETGAVAIIMKPVVPGNKIKLIRPEDFIPEPVMKTLTWVSGEKFTADNREKIDYQITLDARFRANRFMSAIAFPDDKVIMAGDIFNNSIIFKHVPLVENAFFISVGKIGNKYFHASKKLFTGNAKITELDFVEISETLYKKQIDDLGKLGQ